MSALAFWVLVVVTSGSNTRAPEIEFQEFTSKERCEIVKQDILRGTEKYRVTVECRQK